jgi:hypothetical protein
MSISFFATCAAASGIVASSSPAPSNSARPTSSRIISPVLPAIAVRLLLSAVLPPSQMHHCVLSCFSVLDYVPNHVGTSACPYYFFWGGLHTPKQRMRHRQYACFKHEKALYFPPMHGLGENGTGKDFLKRNRILPSVKQRSNPHHRTLIHAKVEVEPH